MMNLDRRRFRVWIMSALCVMLGLGSVSAWAENIDPDNDGSQYAWGENIGWLNAEPNGEGGPGVEVTDTDLTGYLWGENIGWVSLSCVNTGSCGTVDYGVTNDGNGILAGYAWAENSGWISFSCANTSSCGTSNYGVTIDSTTGVFDGKAWAENVGWISFAPMGGPTVFGVTTSWTAVVTVPDVVGQPQATAESNITGAGLAVGIVTFASSATTPLGHVISQSPPGGSSALLGSAVDLVVSLGPPLVEVPDVIGQAQATAEANIVAAGFAVGTVTFANSATIPQNHVISQVPPGGIVVTEGSAVDLVVSLGPALACPECDLNNDGAVNFSDLSAVFPCMGQTSPLSPPCDVADVNGDGIVNFNDVSQIVGNFS